MMNSNQHIRSIHTQGFTLVEVSIVLVIVGLLVGGTLLGRDLIQTAQIRKVIKEYEAYSIGINSFKTQFNALPGDMRTATEYWGAADTPPATCQITPSVGDVATCDGDGNGNIGEYDDDDVAYERFRFWQHLANAELLGTTMSGVSGPLGASHSVIGTNIPPSSYAGAGWSIYYLGNRYTDGLWFDGYYGNAFVFGAENASGTAPNVNGVITPAEAWNIDTKIDDAKPSQGIVTLRYNGTSASCHNGASSSDVNAAYEIEYFSPDCTMLFKSGF